MIIYLHGLNSSGSSAKAAVLRRALAPVEVISPDYPAQSAQDAVSTLMEAFNTQPGEGPRLLVGSSMGGFYCAWLASRVAADHLVMINPALRPWTLLRQVVGWQYNQARDERYFLSAEMVAATRAYATEPASVGVPVTLLHDKGDELIDYREAVADYGGIADIRLFEGGSHAFDHMEEAVGIIGDIHRSLK